MVVIIMAPEGMAAVLRAPNQLCCFVFSALFVTHFVHNISATISYDRKERLDSRTEITHLEHYKSFLFNLSSAGVPLATHLDKIW